MNILILMIWTLIKTEFIIYIPGCVIIEYSLSSYLISRLRSGKMLSSDKCSSSILDLQPEIIAEIISWIYRHSDRFTHRCQIFNLCQISKKLCPVVISAVPYIKSMVIFKSRFIDLFRRLEYLSMVCCHKYSSVNLEMFNKDVFSNLVRLEISSVQAAMFRKPDILDEMFDQSEYRLNRLNVPILYNLDYLNISHIGQDRDYYPMIDSSRFPRLDKIVLSNFIIPNIIDFQTVSSLEIENIYATKIPEDYLTGTRISKLILDIDNENDYELDIQNITDLTISHLVDLRFTNYQNITDLECPSPMLDEDLDIQQMIRLERLKIRATLFENIEINTDIYPRSIQSISILSHHLRESGINSVTGSRKFKLFPYCVDKHIPDEHRRLMISPKYRLYKYSELYIF